MALGITGHGGFISQPLAIVVIGGLVSSTVLTLLVLPTLYNLVEGAHERRLNRRIAGDAGASGSGAGTEAGAGAEAGAGGEAGAGSASPDAAEHPRRARRGRDSRG